MVGDNVTLGDGVHLHSHVVVDGRTTIGAHTKVFPFASLGLAPQDLKFKGEPSTLEIGEHNVIREYVTMNPGTEGGGMATRVGNRCLFMVGTHVAHDCHVGNHVIMANNATLAGHVEVGDFVIIGGLAAVHQFVRIGRQAIIGGLSGVEHDVIPYGSVIGERGWLAGLNLVGLKRRGFAREHIHALRNAFRMLFLQEEGETLAVRMQQVKAEYEGIETVQEMIAFMEGKGSRSLLTPRFDKVPEKGAGTDDEQ
jgi:UDP-N-acetylglucosamine acyltransferase